MWRSGRGRGIRVAAAGAMLALVSAVTPVHAAPVTYQVDADADCVAGKGPRAKVLTLQLRARDGSLVATRRPTTDAKGRFRVCFPDDGPRAGASLVARRGKAVLRTWRLPTLTVFTDRDTDAVKGRAPKGARLRVVIRDCTTVPGTCRRVLDRSVRADTTGHYLTDFTTEHASRGHDRAVVRLLTAAGDTVLLERPFPWLLVEPATDHVRGWNNPSDPFAVDLHTDRGHLVLDFFDGTGGDGTFDVTWPLNVGARVRAGIAAITVPETSLHHVAGEAIASGSCLADAGVRLTWNDGASRSAVGAADDAGAFTVDVGAGGGPAIPPGTAVTVTCYAASGDRLRFVGETPGAARLNRGRRAP